MARNAWEGDAVKWLELCRRSQPWLLGTMLALGSVQASAFPQIQIDWQNRYGAVSSSAENAQCRLCHANPSGGSPWNAYGWDVRTALDDVAGCDLDDDGDVSNAEAFFCVESLNSDQDSGANDNLSETAVSTQPGWTQGPVNTLFTRVGEILDQLPPADIGPLDPDGTEPIPPVLPPPPGDDEPDGPPLYFQLLSPGQSVQRAIDRAAHGGWIFLRPGVYREIADPTNGLNISKGLKLVGVPDGDQEVVLENAGNQRNGIVAVPDDRVDCMSCHESMAPPFELSEGVEPGLTMREPMIHDLRIQGITIRGFRNNGLFTENVDGFEIIGVKSIDNRNYGIFPTLSKNGVIQYSYASGSDDSGIWVETSENVRVVQNLVEGNVNGFEVSNSDDIHLARNEARYNTVGFSILLLPDIFDDRPGSKRITLWRNRIHDNNKVNTARPGSILSTVPSGIGILHLGVDDSQIAKNRIQNNDFSGIAIVDYCVVVLGTPFACTVDPSVTPEFVADSKASNNEIFRNLLVGNGTNPGDTPFAPFAADLTLATVPDDGNCFEDNEFDTSTRFGGGPLPACD